MPHGQLAVPPLTRHSTFVKSCANHQPIAPSVTFSTPASPTYGVVAAPAYAAARSSARAQHGRSILPSRTLTDVVPVVLRAVRIGEKATERRTCAGQLERCAEQPDV